MMFFKYFCLRTIILNPPISQPVASVGRGEFVAAAIVVVEEGTGVGGGLPMDFVFFNVGLVSKIVSVLLQMHL